MILSQKKFQKLERNVPISKQAEAKRDGAINPHTNNSINFKMENFDAIKLLRSSTFIAFYYAPFEKGGHIALHLSVGRSVCMSVCRYVGIP